MTDSYTQLPPGQLHLDVSQQLRFLVPKTAPSPTLPQNLLLLGFPHLRDSTVELLESETQGHLDLLLFFTCLPHLHTSLSHTPILSFFLLNFSCTLLLPVFPTASHTYLSSGSQLLAFTQ